MRIAELARRAGVSRETIHFYLREGLLPRPRKTGRNMAYYDEGHVEHIQAIKRLQNEKYLPLSVIKKVLRGARAPGRPEDVELVAELFTLGEQPARPVPAKELGRRTGAGPALVRAAAEAGVLQGERDEHGALVYRQEDVDVLRALHELEVNAGFPIDFALELTRSAIVHLDPLVRDEARLVFGRFLGGTQPARAVEALRRSRAIMNRVLVLLRARRMQREIENYFEQLEGAITGSERLAIAPLGATALRATKLAALEKAAAARVKARPGDPAAARALVQLLMGVGQFERAAAETERALGRAPDDPVLLRMDGACRFELGADDPAITRLARAAELDPGDTLVHAYLGSAYLRRARDRVSMLGAAALAEAGAGVAALTASRRVRPADPADELRVALVRGRVYGVLPRFLGMFEEGLGELRRLLEIAESWPPGHPLAESGELVWLRANAELLLAQLHEATRDRETARGHAHRAAALDPDGPIAQRAARLLERLDAGTAPPARKRPGRS